MYYQVIHQRKVRQVNPDYHVFPSEWDEKKSTLKAVRGGMRSGVINNLRERIREDIERINKIGKLLESSRTTYSVDDVVEEFMRYTRDYSLFKYMEGVIEALRNSGRHRTSETYTSALQSFRKFRQEEDIMLDCITGKVMQDFEAWHRGRGVTPNTISFYTRILRAVYNRAVDQNIIDDRTPFRHVYTGVDKTVKRALPIRTIKKIKRLDLSKKPCLEYARDMFIMSFYLRGMSFIDMAYLQESDLKRGVLTYRRHKTGQKLMIGWTGEMEALRKKHGKPASGYLLPIFKEGEEPERTRYRNKMYRINHNLKEVAALAGVSVPLTLYVARHSWASAAKAKGVPLGVISEGMGHDSEQTTRIYLASLDSKVVDKANTMLIRSLE